MKRSMMLLLSGIVATGLACPVYADKGDDVAAEGVAAAATDAQFMNELKSAGFTYSNPTQAIAAAQVVCVMAARGRPGLDIILDLKKANPGLTTDRAAEFAKIASQTYCAQQLDHK